MVVSHDPAPANGLSTRTLHVVDLGVIPYAEAWELQKSIAEEVGRGDRAETLLLLEHPHTYTCGRRGGRDHILIGQAELDEKGITVLDVDRGGDVTYHGPGQLVAYPIINVADEHGNLDYHAYVRYLEQVLIDLLANVGINAHRVAAYTGVWTEASGAEEKIAAIGVKVDGRGVTTHGIALNVTTDLGYFDLIVPCGITDKGVTSLRALLGEAPAMSQVKQSFAAEFCRVFGYRDIGIASEPR